jgi:hypothetical protein
MGILRTRVRPGFAEIEIFFVFESLARRTIGNPILLVLIQVKRPSKIVTIRPSPAVIHPTQGILCRCRAEKKGMSAAAVISVILILLNIR